MCETRPPALLETAGGHGQRLFEKGADVNSLPQPLTIFDGRVCLWCNLWKPFEDFYTRTNGTPTAHCRKCALNKYHHARRDEELAKMREWHATHKEQSRAYIANRNAADPTYTARAMRRSYAKHSEKRKEYARQFRAAYPERQYALCRRWRRNNPEKVTAAIFRREALKRGLTEHHTATEWRALKVCWGNRCLCCGVSGEVQTLATDHIVPLSRGGANTIDNIQPLCKSCNSRKGTKTIDYRVGQPNNTEPQK